MRYLLLSSALLLAGLATAALAAEPIRRTVHLDSVVLEELKKSNPHAYAQVQRVMTSASEMCKPNAARTWALTNAPSPSCSALFLKASYPPKRRITVAVEDTLYIADVIVRDAPALAKAEPGQAIPLLGNHPK